MFTNYSTIPIKLGILLVGVGLLVVGCDSAGTNNGQNNQDEAEEAIAFEAADWSENRVTDLNGNSSSNAKAAAQKSMPGFAYNTHVDPPSITNNAGNTAAASHLAASTTNNGNTVLYVGYKTVKDAYGGGIDILKDDGSLDEATGSGTDALEESDVDVQELAVEEDQAGEPNVLYAATAVDPDATVSQSPQFHSINLKSNGKANASVKFDAFDLDRAGNDGTDASVDVATVAKSVTVLDGISGADAFVASDSSFGYTIETGNDYNIDGTTLDDESDIDQLRNVTQTPDDQVMLALDFSGDLWRWSSGWGSSKAADLTGDLSNPGPSPGDGGENDGIARLTTHNFDGTNYSFENEDLVFAALNGDGFEVYSTQSSTVRYSSRDDADDDNTVPEIYASSVEVTDNFVYVASGTTIALYEIKSGLANNDTKVGLKYLGQESFEDRSFATGEQINDIHVDASGSNNILYVAKSEDGVIKLTQNSLY